MSTNLENPIRLQNLTYSDLIENLGHVCFGNYHLPENDDSVTTVNNEYSFDRWKQRLMYRYPKAIVLFDSKAIWSRRVSVIDQTFEYDKQMFSKIKAGILNDATLCD